MTGPVGPTRLVIRCVVVPRSTFARALAVALLAAAPAVRANPASIVPSVSGPNHIVLDLDYAYEQDTSTIAREHTGTDPTGAVPTSDELTFHQTRHVITPHADIGFAPDTWISVALPIVVSQTRELDLAPGADRASLSTVADGILPAAGYDARDPTAPPGGDVMFRGVERHGLDQLDLGLGVAPMNQAHHPTQPTWKIGAELRLAIGKAMAFDPTAPGANTAVGQGVHELRLWTSFDRRLGWAEPWMTMYWQVPIGLTKDSPYHDPGFGATNTQKQQEAGVAFGFEAYALDDKANANRVSLDLGSRIVAHFEGRGYTEMWEVFAAAGNASAGGPLVLDADPTTPNVQAMSYPGVSNIENYLETAAHVALRAQLGPHVRFAAVGDVAWQSEHAISFADSGVDLPTCMPGQTRGCETDDNTVVNPGTPEVNPLHVQRIDLVGHRYISHAALGLTFGVEGEVLF